MIRAGFARLLERGEGAPAPWWHEWSEETAVALAHWELLMVDGRSCCAAMRSVPGFRLSIWWLIVAVCGGLVGTVALAGDEEYLPLNEGDEWTMDAVVEGPDGKKKTATLRRRVGEQVERGGKVYRTVRTWSDNGFDERKLMRKDEKGVHSITLNSEDQAEQVEMVLPLKVGQEWTRRWRGGEVKERVEKIETVKIGEKTYGRCYHIHSEAMDGSFWEDYWEAPAVGWVRSIASAGDGKMTLTLREFKAGKR